eukprot:CAMPEP_0114997812 /NCGR_PEP_ID=MMETSP0216-20121206/15116_1 /TAXON_ID=223996 /ORGANISM="Protocruzia adherens, Strain Boccale" /LENGTH=389 /DNA_ID=CAMNT_0002362253 /DNA_START=56 /DNA_END=1225 /DNA_ORIENTATION=+
MKGSWKKLISRSQFVPLMKPFSSAPAVNEGLNILKTYSDVIDGSGVLEKIMPRKFDQAGLNQFIGGIQFSQNDPHFEAINKGLCDPLWDLLDRGGKRWRPAMAMMVYDIYKDQLPNADEIYNQVLTAAGLCEIVHNATLIGDDIEDGSDFRRGKPAVHLIHGHDVSINAYAMFCLYPIRRVELLGNLTPEIKNQLYDVCLREVTSVHLGQAWDIMWHNGHGFPTPDQYLEMVNNKTGVLARLGIRLACILMGRSPEETDRLGILGSKVGIAFQIQDDVVNLTSEEFAKGKGYLGEDIHEGKKSLMVIHACQNSDKADRLKEILEMKTKDQDLIHEAISIIKEAGSIKFARERAAEIVEQAWNDIDSYLPETQGKKNLHSLCNLLIDRDY